MASGAGEGFFGFVGESEAARRLVAVLDRVRRTELSVLIEGAAGTGRDLVARLLHDHGPRAGRPFVALHCGAMPGGLVDSALFGHSRGAFTGAVEARRGAFEAADGGTLYLDDVGSLSREAQPRLLRVLSDGRVQPVGSSEARLVDVRVVASVREGEGALLREDLLFRLAAVRVRLPSLSERGADVPALVRHFVARHGAAAGGRGFSEAALAALCRARLAGEVRQLEAIVRAALALSDGPEVDEDLVLSLVMEQPGRSSGEGVKGRIQTLAEVEREAVAAALAHFKGNKKRTAEALGIDRSTLYAKLRLHGLLARP
jgi:serine/threonine-protein kinase PknK